MSDKVPPTKKTAKKGKSAAAKKTPGPKLVAAGVKPGIGHNSGQQIPEFKKIVEEIIASGERQKTEAKLQRDLRNRAKTEFGFLSGPLAHEIRLRKLDPDVRVQFESGHKDIKTALGYQPELDFAGAQPTQASVKAQPPEAEMPQEQAPQEGEAGYSVEDEDPEDKQPAAAEGDKNPDPLAIPPALQRPRKDIIEREG